MLEYKPNRNFSVFLFPDLLPVLYALHLIVHPHHKKLTKFKTSPLLDWATAETQGGGPNNISTLHLKSAKLRYFNLNLLRQLSLSF